VESHLLERQILISSQGSEQCVPCQIPLQIAITSSRIISHSSTKVLFKYKDYRRGNQNKIMSPSPWECVRRFTQYILPHGFTRIRHYGILHSRWKIKLFPNTPTPRSTSNTEFKFGRADHLNPYLFQPGIIYFALLAFLFCPTNFFAILLLIVLKVQLKLFSQILLQ